jgi:hypothetical protein
MSPFLLLFLVSACSDYTVSKIGDDAVGASADDSGTLEADTADALADGDGDGHGESADGDDPDDGDGPDVPDDTCERAANISGYLDRFQVAGDGRVLYCHSSSGRGFVVIASDISSCLPHLDHRYDIFPTSLCDS